MRTTTTKAVSQVSLHVPVPPGFLRGTRAELLKCERADRGMRVCGEERYNGVRCELGGGVAVMVWQIDVWRLEAVAE